MPDDDTIVEKNNFRLTLSVHNRPIAQPNETHSTPSLLSRLINPLNPSAGILGIGTPLAKSLKCIECLIWPLGKGGPYEKTGRVNHGPTEQILT